MNLMHGDCLELLWQIPDGSVDMIMCDLPYGTTAAKWDSVIDINSIWYHYERILKPNRTIALTSLQPFTTTLISSNIGMFKYAFVWVKTKALGFQNAKLRPMTRHEDVLIFSRGNSANRAANLMTYNPQGLVELNKIVKGSKKGSSDAEGHRMCRPNHKEFRVQEFTGYPDTVLEIPSEGATVHPTQKPVALMEYLILTYTNPGDTVLDNCMGSGTTGVACMNTGREFIGMEQHRPYFDIAERRIYETWAATLTA